MVAKHLYETIQDRVGEWHSNCYPCPEYPTIAEILEYTRLSWSRGIRSQSNPENTTFSL